jgi:hypothetical protein
MACRHTVDQVGIVLSGGPESFTLHKVQVQFLEVVVEVRALLLVVVHLLHWERCHVLDKLPYVAVVPMLPRQMQLIVKRTMVKFLVAR